MDPKPTNVKLDLATNRLDVTWSDGTASAYDGGYLRFVCPCAGCRGHAPGEVAEPTWEQCHAVRLTNARQVGSYALGFEFSDGHTTGIYAYDLLWSKRPDAVEGVDELGRPLPAS